MSAPQIDTGINTAVTVRANVFAGAVPAANPTTDNTVATATKAGHDVHNPEMGYTNPPSATAGKA